MAGFHDVQFPTDISLGASGGPSYRTTVIQTKSGFEQRIAEFDNAQLAWNIGAQTWSQARLNTLLAFFHARQGKAYGFRFKDWSDYFAGMLYSTGGTLIYDTASLQQIGTGDGATTVFQIVKLYSSGGVTQTRKITRPVAGTVQVYFGTTLQASGWTVDNSTGLVTFAVAPAASAVINAAYQFDCPVRFDTDQMLLNMENIWIGGWPSIPIVGIKE